MEKFINLAEFRLANAEWRIRQVPVPRARRIIYKAAIEAGVALLEAKGLAVDSADFDVANWIERLFVTTGELSVEHLATVASACKYLKFPHEEAQNELGDDLRRVQAFVQAARILLVQRQLDWVVRAPIDYRYDFTPPGPENNDREFEQELFERTAAYEEWGPEIRRKAKVAM
jgi:hypothetical protein